MLFFFRVSHCFSSTRALRCCSSHSRSNSASSKGFFSFGFVFVAEEEEDEGDVVVGLSALLLDAASRCLNSDMNVGDEANFPCVVSAANSF
jgi:hypothetical protein